MACVSVRWASEAPRRAKAAGIWSLVLAAGLFAGAHGVAAHEAHRKAADSTAHATGDATSAPDTTVEATAGATDPVDERYSMPPMTEVVREHLHNKLVHFPIALSIAAALLLLFGTGRREVERVATMLIWGAAITAVAAYFSGRAQEEPFEGHGKEWLVEWHRTFGTATAVTMLLWGGAALFGRTRRWARWIGLGVALLVLATATYGGLVAHG